MKILAFLVLSYLSMGVSSCTSIPFGDKTLTPKEAGIYNAVFGFNCNGSMKTTYGVGSCQYSEGEALKVTVIVPSDEGEIQIRSCRHHRSYQIQPKVTDYTWEWIQFTKDDSCPVIFSVTTKNSGAYFGAVYPYVYTKDYPKLELQYSSYCFIDEQFYQGFGQYNCQYPTNIEAKVDFTAKKEGKYLATSVCNIANNNVAQPVPANKIIAISLKEQNPKFCPLNVAVKYADGTYEEFEGYFSFFDTAFRFIPVPTVEDKGDSFRVCAPKDYVFFTINDWWRRESFWNSRCKTVDKQDFSSIVFDKYGRASTLYIKKDGKYNLNRMGEGL